MTKLKLLVACQKHSLQFTSCQLGEKKSSPQGYLPHGSMNMRSICSRLVGNWPWFVETPPTIFRIGGAWAVSETIHTDATSGVSETVAQLLLLQVQSCLYRQPITAQAKTTSTSTTSPLLRFSKPWKTSQNATPTPQLPSSGVHRNTDKSVKNHKAFSCQPSESPTSWSAQGHFSLLFMKL